MFAFKGPRLNITFLDIKSIEGSVKVYNKPLPCIAKKRGGGRSVFPLFTREKWVHSLLRDNNEVAIDPEWRNNQPIFVPEDTFKDKFVLLQGDIHDTSVMCALKPHPSNAVKVEVPACIERNGRIIMLDSNDILLSNKLGAKFVMEERSFLRLFSDSPEKACQLSFNVKMQKTIDNEQALYTAP